MQKFLSLLNRFKRDERGIFAVFFGILAVVLVATAGAVVDFTTVEQARARAQDALDSAALGLQPTIADTGVTEATLQSSAQLIVNEHLVDQPATATVTNVDLNTTTGMLRIEADVSVPTAFVQLVGVPTIQAHVLAEAKRGSMNLEVALALDITGSMGSVDDPNSKINALKTAANAIVPLIVQDVQTPSYSKMALIPWSSAVNVGAYAASLRGAATQNTTITAASWIGTGSTNVRTVSAISKQNPARVTTSANHGYTTGQTVTITNVAGGGFTVLNGNTYTITVISSTVFSLTGVNSTSWTGTYTASSGRTTMGIARAIASITKASQAIVTTSANHGLTTGDAVYITSAAGGDFTNLNNDWYTVQVNSPTQIRLNSTNTNSYSGTYTANSAVLRKCDTNECEITITSAAHGIPSGGHVFINNASWLNSVAGDDEVSSVWEVSAVTTDTYVLENSTGPDMGTYAANGRSWCTVQGCEYYYFENKDTNYSLHRIRTCVTERVGADQYTDTDPATTFVGRQYTNSSSDCLTPQIIPLTSTKSTLTTAITNLTTTSTTAGQVGTAWAWYMLAPNFGSLWPTAAERPAAYDAPFTKKIAIIMTDGEYNTPYCNGVVASDHIVPTWVQPNSRTINCVATNGASLTQAGLMCAAMKVSTGPNIKIYTVGFQLGSDVNVINMLSNCATTPGDAYLASDNAALLAAFQAIGNDISDLRLAQ